MNVNKKVSFLFISACPVEWPSKQPTPQHVWGPGPAQDNAHLHPGGLRITPQGLHPATDCQSHQTAGGGGFPRTSESEIFWETFWISLRILDKNLDDIRREITSNVLVCSLQTDQGTLPDSNIPLSGRSQMIREKLHGESCQKLILSQHWHLLGFKGESNITFCSVPLLVWVKGGGV